MNASKTDDTLSPFGVDHTLFCLTKAWRASDSSSPIVSTSHVSASPRPAKNSLKAYLVLALFQGLVRHGIKSFKDVHLHDPSLATTHVIQDPVDRLLRVVPGNGRFRVREELGVGRQRICGATEGQEEQFRGLLQSFESP